MLVKKKRKFYSHFYRALLKPCDITTDFHPLSRAVSKNYQEFSGQLYPDFKHFPNDLLLKKKNDLSAIQAWSLVCYSIWDAIAEKLRGTTTTKRPTSCCQT
ncbi:hypothetical protein [Enterococcus sp. DIV0086]|uniref:hypothetical protein n=1 Tax=Enterococcus sp. DIV0086 TaxID=2774655 RepID=UPI003D29FDFA